MECPQYPIGEKLGGWPHASPPDTSEFQTSDSFDWPKFSLIMPSYKQGKYIEEAILSVIKQNYPNLEFIVMDGGSDDSSVELIKKYSEHMFFWKSEQDNGQADAIASGFDMSTGEIQCWLNSDDVLLPNTLKKVGDVFRRNRHVNFLYGNRIVIDDRSRVLGHHVWPRYLTRHHWYGGQPMAQECCFWRRQLYLDAGQIDRSLYFVMDYDLFFRMWGKRRFKKMNDFLGALRSHDDAKHIKNIPIQVAELQAAREKYKLKQPGYLASRLLRYADKVQKGFDKLCLGV